MSHPIEHMISGGTLARAKELAERHRHDEAFRGYVVHNFGWILPLFCCCLVACALAAFGVNVSIRMIPRLLATTGETWSASSISMVGLVAMVTAGLTFVCVFYLSAQRLLLWLERLMLDQARRAVRDKHDPWYRDAPAGANQPWRPGKPWYDNAPSDLLFEARNHQIPTFLRQRPASKNDPLFDLLLALFLASPFIVALLIFPNLFLPAIALLFTGLIVFMVFSN